MQKLRLITLRTRYLSMVRYELEPANMTLASVHWLGLMRECDKHGAVAADLTCAIAVRLMHGRQLALTQADADVAERAALVLYVQR